MNNNMHKVCNDRLIKTLKEIVAYLFLYGVFLGTFYDFAYDAWICAKPIGLMLVLLKALGFLFLCFGKSYHNKKNSRIKDRCNF